MPPTRLFLKREDGQFASIANSQQLTQSNLLLTSSTPRFRFFLHYTARDAVDVLAQGTGGVAEMRDAAEVYRKDNDAKPSPLFGMIHFRRRKVLVKLIVDGTSRLIQGNHWLPTAARTCDG
jgi:hypothetical protein